MQRRKYRFGVTGTAADVGHERWPLGDARSPRTTKPSPGGELRRLAKTLRRWREQIYAHHGTGDASGPVERRT